MKKTTLMRVPLSFKFEIDSIAKERKVPATKILSDNVGLFKKGEKLRKFLGW